MTSLASAVLPSTGNWNSLARTQIEIPGFVFEATFLVLGVTRSFFLGEILFFFFPQIAGSYRGSYFSKVG